MKPGKVPGDVLVRAVFPHLGKRSDVLVHAHLGEDCAAVDFGDSVCIVTCDPITGAQHHLGHLAVHIACNDLATTGAEPVALLLTLLLKEGTSDQGLEHIMEDAGRAAASLAVEIVGGHTEVTPGIDRTIAVMMAVGRAPRGKVVSASAAAPGQSVVLTKGAGIEGTAILATDLAERLAAHLDQALLARARAFLDRISVVPEGMIAAKRGAIAMHDVTEGGVLGGTWELAEAAGVGVELWADRVPVLPETAAICKVLGVDPLSLISSGAMLITTRSPADMIAAITAQGIFATEIGVITDRDRVLLRQGRRMPLVPPSRDELWRVLENSGTPNS